MTKCCKCGCEIDELAVFPGHICVTCHAAKFDAALNAATDKAAFWESQRPNFRKTVRR